MIGDLPPMSPCPYAKRGEHEGVVITRESEDLVMVACCACGMVRIVRPSAMPPLDDMDADEIARRIGADYLTSTLRGTETR